MLNASDVRKMQQATLDSALAVFREQHEKHFEEIAQELKRFVRKEPIQHHMVVNLPCVWEIRKTDTDKALAAEILAEAGYQVTWYATDNKKVILEW